MQLTAQEVGLVGTLVVVFALGVGEVVQVVSIGGGQASNAALQAAEKSLRLQIAASATTQQKALRDALNTYVSPFLQQLKPRHGDTK